MNFFETGNFSIAVILIFRLNLVRYLSQFVRELELTLVESAMTFCEAFKDCSFELVDFVTNIGVFNFSVFVAEFVCLNIIYLWICFLSKYLHIPEKLMS